ncbi:ATP synthase subunit I [Ramlibacter montanisoli]|uniref:ATP synthase subunit I n=1 Tax=Ramlibacter montanisoli TaxID=2732512 RepID=UPI00359F48A8
MPTRRIAPLPEEDTQESPVQPLSADEARRVRELNPRYPRGGWWWDRPGWGSWPGWPPGSTGKHNVGWSVAYGALAVLIPAAVFARGLTGKFASLNAGTAAVGFLLWEMVKIALTLALIALAPRLVAGLSWPALLIGLVLAMKVYWVALAFVPRPKTKSS